MVYTVKVRRGLLAYFYLLLRLLKWKLLVRNYLLGTNSSIKKRDQKDTQQNTIKKDHT